MKKTVPTLRAVDDDVPPQMPAELHVALAGIADLAREGLLAMSVGVGLAVMVEMMEEELTAKVGPKHAKIADRAASRHASAPGSVALGGRRAIRRPPARTTEGTEVALETYATFASDDLLTRWCGNGCWPGWATRRRHRGPRCEIGRCRQARRPRSRASHDECGCVVACAVLVRFATCLHEEVDGDHYRAVDDKVVRDTRRDGLAVTGDEVQVERRLCRHHEPDGTLDDAQASPRALGNEMAPAQRRGKALLVEGPCHPRHTKAEGKLGAIAERAFELGTDVGGATELGQHPAPLRERRTVANVLAVEARQFGHPVTIVILAEAHDAAQHLCVPDSLARCATPREPTPPLRRLADRPGRVEGTRREGPKAPSPKG